MDRTIVVDERVYEHLKDQAEPFADTPNSVLRRLLGLGPSQEDETETESASGNVGVEPGTRRSGQLKPLRRQRSGARATRTRAPAGSLLPEEEYHVPILRVLVEAGGSAPAAEIIEMVGKELDGRLTDMDRLPLQSGGSRWRSRMQFARLRLIERGLMARNSPRGTWTISEAGRLFVAENT